MKGLERLQSDTSKGLSSLYAMALGGAMNLKDAIEDGDFERAIEQMHEIGPKINALQFAEQQIAVLGANTLLRAREVQVGMHIQGSGVVAAIEQGEEPCTSGRHHHPYVKFYYEDGPDAESFAPSDQLIIILVDSEAPNRA